MEVITSYKSFDGKIFETGKECLEYEKQRIEYEEKIREENEILEKANEIKHYCIKHLCHECAFCDTYGNCVLGNAPNGWDV